MDSVQLPFHFDVDALQRDLAQIGLDEYYWIENPYLEKQTLRGLNLVLPVFNEDPGAKPQTEQTKILKQSPAFLEVYNTFQCPVVLFRVHVLSAGANINPHRDGGFSIEAGRTRIHIPIQTDPRIVTELGGVPKPMSEGECWYHNFELTHHIRNESDVNRVHLIIDCETNDWLRGIFEQSGYVQKEMSIYDAMDLDQLRSMAMGLREVASDAAHQILQEVEAAIARKS